MGVQNLGPCSDFQLKPQQIGPASRGGLLSLAPGRVAGVSLGFINIAKWSRGRAAQKSACNDHLASCLSVVGNEKYFLSA